MDLKNPFADFICIFSFYQNALKFAKIKNQWFDPSFTLQIP